MTGAEKIAATDRYNTMFHEIAADQANAKIERMWNTTAGQSPNGQHSQSGDFIPSN